MAHDDSLYLTARKYKPDDAIFTQIIYWCPEKNYALVLNPDDTRETAAIIRDNLHPHINKQTPASQVEKRWIRFRYKDLEYTTDPKNRARIKDARMIHKVPEKFDGLPANILRPLKIKKKPKPSE